MKKSTEGFTLIELVVGIFCATLITGAAMSLMLMGLRNTQSLTVANTNLQNARIILTMVEKLASEGAVQKIEVDDNDSGHHSWALYSVNDATNDPVLRYSSAEKVIYSKGDSVLMENVSASSLTLSKAPMGGSLLGCTISCEDGVYETVAYSRHEEIESEGIVLDKTNVSIMDTTRPDAPTLGDAVEIDPEEILTEAATVTGGRTAFLSILSSQYGSSGQIIGFYPTVHFSQWYIGGYTDEVPDWNEDTPWCACFVSWGAAVINKQSDNTYLRKVPRFASVEDAWKTNGYNTFAKTYAQADRDSWKSTWMPTPGDLIFFEWGNSNGILDHIGVVFYADNNYIYTIEGNSNDKVAIQRYKADSSLIHGYAVLDWLNP